jgi:hypothetical protein
VARLKEKKRVSLKKEKAKNYKMILNALTAENQGITQGIITRSLNKIKQPE